MIRVCNGAYLAQQLMSMEIKILKIIDYKVHTTEPTLCVNYYLKLVKLTNDSVSAFRGVMERETKLIADLFQLLNATICYVMDGFSLSPYFSSTPVVVLAAACLKYTFAQYYDDKTVTTILYLFNRILTGREMDEMNRVERLIYLQMKGMAVSNYPFQEPFHKYSRKERRVKAGLAVEF